MNTMAEMFGSAFVQEAVSRGISYVLGKRKEMASQGHLMERLEMAASDLESAHERTKELPIIHPSLLQRRNQIKNAYSEAMKLLHKHKRGQGVKRPRWISWAKSMSFTRCAGLSTDHVRIFEWYAERADKFVRDMVSGCSLHHYTFCNPIVRHLLEGKSLKYHLKQGNLRRDFYIWPTYSYERCVEAVLAYRYEDSTMAKKCFKLRSVLRLTESTDIVGVAIKGLQFLTSGFKLAAECAIGEFTLLSNSQDIGYSHAAPMVGVQKWHISHTQFGRPDQACCKRRRQGLCANNNNVPSGLADIFPEQVIYWVFECYVSALESSTHRPDDEGGRSKTRGWEPPLVLAAGFWPHVAIGWVRNSFTVETIGDAEERRDARIQQTPETVKSRAINCFLRQPDLTLYQTRWYSKHGGAWFEVQKPPSTERTGGGVETRSYNTLVPRKYSSWW